MVILSEFSMSHRLCSSIETVTVGKKHPSLFKKIVWNFSRYGIECLFRFYSYGLEKKFRSEVYKDFQEDTLTDYHEGQLYGLEKFWAFLRYSGRNDKDVNPELKTILAKFKTVDDFRVLPPKNNEWKGIYNAIKCTAYNIVFSGHGLGYWRFASFLDLCIVLIYCIRP